MTAVQSERGGLGTSKDDDADPVRHERHRLEEERDRLRLAVVAAASDVRSGSAVRFRTPGLLVAAIIVVVGTAAVGSKIWLGGGTTLQAAVRFEVRLAETHPASGLREVRIAGSDRVVYLHQEIVVTSDDISQSRITERERPSRFDVAVTFNATGAEKMRQATASHNRPSLGSHTSGTNRMPGSASASSAAQRDRADNVRRGDGVRLGATAASCNIELLCSLLSDQRLGDFLDFIGADRRARFITVTCADDYYESLDMSGLRIFDAFPSFGSKVPERDLIEGVPPAITLGGWLGGALQWHFTFMWIFAAGGVLYVIAQIASGHYRTVAFTRRDIAGVWPMVRHYFLFGPKPVASGQYNPLQKLAYTTAIGLWALSLLTGIVMYKPAQFSTLGVVFGGYHGARLVHFLAMCGLLAFIPGHLVMVALHGWENFESMLIGWKRHPEYTLILTVSLLWFNFRIARDSRGTR